MKTVSVSELKAHLSRYLREVRRGSEIQVLDRGVPIARLTQAGAEGGNGAARRRRLARAGVLRIGSGRVARILKSKPLDVGTRVSDALIADRADRL
jgi:prevent-host-death family protein